MSTTTTLLGTPDPDEPRDPFTTETTPMDLRKLDPTDRPSGAGEPMPMVVDGEVITSLHDTTPAPDTDDDTEDEDQDGEPRRAVDPPAGEVSGRELLPWQRREVARRPVIAQWLTRTEDVRAATRWAAGWVWHATGFHAVRLPLYLAKLARWSPRGLWVALRAGVRWVNDTEAAALRDAAISGNESDTYLKLTAARAERVRVRRRLALVAVLLATAGVLVAPLLVPAGLLWLAATLAVLVLGKVGTPVDRPIAGASVVRTTYQRLTSELVVDALRALGIAAINQAYGKGGTGVTFPSPITRDGPGWRADVDLPRGVVVTDIVERRDRLASGLRRPLGCVWPEPMNEEHAGRLTLWVGDTDMAKSKPVVWPLAKRGNADLFRPIPFGVDQRGRLVALLLMFESVLIGSKPRMGKTFAMRVLILAAVLDALAQLRVFELKGTGDLSMIANSCHHYGSGADQDTLDACMVSLREIVQVELIGRAKTIQRLPRELCPENKVTPQLSARRELGLHPIVIAIDECQELFTNAEHKDEAATLTEAIIKRGPALGIILILATQRPDAKSLPTGVSANIGIRFCLRVMGQTENDMVLGTSSYQNGIRATTFTAKDRGIGYLIGAADDPQIVRTAYIDGPAAETIAARGRALREAAGTVTGHAAGDIDETATAPRRSILGDIGTVFGPDEDRLWSDTIATRLTAQWPDTYKGITPAILAGQLKPYGLAPAQVWGTDPDTGEGRNRRGYLRDTITTAWLATRKTTDKPDAEDGPDAGRGHAA